jgi:hypothetical protein
VIPHLPKDITCNNPLELCEDIYHVWMTIKKKYREVLAIADCHCPVETNLFAQAIKSKEQIREFTGPFPLHEVATALLMAGMDRSKYSRNALELPEHNPLNDARYSARLFITALKS